MSTRPLRTAAATNPRTQGERIRYARLAMDISQAEFAARVSRSGGGKITKSLVSQWERGGVKNPNNANMLAIQAITGFSMGWIINGKGPEKVTIPLRKEADSIIRLDTKQLARAIAATIPGLPNVDQHARTIAGLYDLLGDTPDLTPDLLARFAATLSRS